MTRNPYLTADHRVGRGHDGEQPFDLVAIVHDLWLGEHVLAGHASRGHATSAERSPAEGGQCTVVVRFIW
jgi:hypothetical protein